MNSFLYSLFHILMIKPNYDQLEKLRRTLSVNPTAAFDHKAWFPLIANFTTTKQKTKRLCR